MFKIQGSIVRLVLKRRRQSMDDQVKKNSIDWTNWINHELKTPLNRMESLLLTLEKSERCGFDETKIIMMIKDSLVECRSTLDSLYLYNKIQINKIKPSIETVDINQVVSFGVQDCKAAADLKGIQLIIETELLFPVQADEQLIKRAFLNVLENGIKFSPTESKLLISTEEIGDEVLIQISDQGIGIDEDKLSNIFTPYYRVEETSHLPGTGLGLYISKSLLEFHGGSVEVDSVKGSGSTFTLKLPIRKEGES